MGLRVTTGGPRPAQCWFLPNHLAGQLSELRARLETDLVKSAASLLVRIECVRLPTGSVEREHELFNKSLSVRMLPDKSLQVADHFRVPPKLERGIESQLGRAKAPVLEATCVTATLSTKWDIGRDDRPAPQGGGLCRCPVGALMIVLRLRPGKLVGQRLESLRVQGGVAELESVARPPSHK